MSKDARYYWHPTELRFVPSGTSVLPRPYLAQWASNCAVDYIDEHVFAPHGDLAVFTLETDKAARNAFHDVSKQAAGYGTFIHHLCEEALSKNNWIVPKT